MLGDWTGVTAYDRRVFLGYPALIAGLVALHVPISLAALVLNWVAAGGRALHCSALSRRTDGTAHGRPTPSSLFYSTVAMTESTLGAFATAGLLLAERNAVAGGVLLGYGGLIRPMACFAVIGAAFQRLRARRRSPALICATSLAVVMVGYALQRAWTGDALTGVKAYSDYTQPGWSDHIVSFPLVSLLTTPFRVHVPVWKIV